MKNIKKISLYCLTIITIFTSCRKDFEEINSVQLQLQLEFPDTFVDGKVPSGIDVTLRNNITGDQTNLTSDERGQVVANVIPGTYTVTASKAYEPTVAFEIAGYDQEIFVNGSLSPLVVDGSKSAILKLNSSRAGGLVIREFYYSAVTGYIYDGFTEIYNNSNEAIRVDSLFIGATRSAASNNTAASSPYNFLTVHPNEVYLNQVFMIPSNGAAKYLQPGESLVVALDAFNHKSDPNGNKNSPVDLGDADYEVYWRFPSNQPDIDFPDVPNMLHVHAGSTAGFDWNIGINGAGMVIFKVDDTSKLPVIFEPDARTAGTTQYMGVPVEKIIDGVDATANSSIFLSNKRLPATVDASMAYTGATLKGYSVRRKVKSVVEGRTIFMDTNNSAVDFEMNPVASPRKWN
ncbi:DUF4876 domain-containing protein [Sphingobacterium bovistauri]|uniref:DUF4876 domain-containing protein n=1 Tax=Sphingobacterium bovistauri TaxID=2781959 RepID=A0ABS7Z327_9SPHI|nr:DUF4876 domain-containing protein [Sphingobacterium bovistauri]MCA5003992.1 DUF4876 domain-containing protein [Sphingobacterium bovistauri]